MKLEIKNLKVLTTMSEATYCYTAIIYLNGKPFCYAKNRGNGGSDFYDKHEKFNGNYRETLDQINDFCNLSFDYNLETWIAYEIQNQEIKKELKGLIKNKVVYFKDSKIFLINVKYIKTHHEVLVKKLSTSSILNAMNFDDAFSLFKQYA
jgi:hypothetical protein